MAELALAFRLMRRELRGGIRGFGIFLTSLAIGVAMIAGVNSLAAMIGAGLTEDARVMLGGDIAVDLVLHAANGEERRYLDEHGTVSQVMSMRAMAKSADDAKRSLIELRTADDLYPLYGIVSLSSGVALGDALANQTGKWGAAIARPLMARLGVEIGDEIEIGDGRFVVRAVFDHLPDSGIGSLAFGPPVLIAQQALVETGLAAPGALVNYSYRLRVPPNTVIDAWIAQLRSAFPEAGWQIRDYRNASPFMRDLLDRVGLFLTLIGLTSMLVGGIGVGNAVQSYLSSRTRSIAIFKSVGASRRLVFLVYLLQIAVLAALGIAIGLFLGVLAPFVTVRFLPADLAAVARLGIYGRPLAFAAASGMLTTLIFALGPLFQASRTAPITLFRDGARPLRGRLSPRLVAMQAAAVSLLSCLVIVNTSDHGFAAWCVFGTLLSLAAFRGAGTLITLAVRYLDRPDNAPLRIALANLARPDSGASVVIASLGIGLTVLVFLALVEGNIMLLLDQEMPSRAPSFFFIDIQPDQAAAFDTLIHGFRGVSEYDRVPSLRGRIDRINDVPVEQSSGSTNERSMIRGERGLTTSQVLPKGSRLVTGSWWPSGYAGQPLVSVDADFAKTMGLKLGDTVTVNVIGRDITATVANFRSVNWASLGINFFMVFSPGTFAGAPESDIATAKIAADQESSLERAVGDRFPNISAIPVKDALETIGQIVVSVATAIQLAAGITLLSAGLVLAGALNAMKRHKLYETVIFKVLGATRVDLLKSFLFEYGLIGILAAAIAIAFGTVAADLVMTRIMRSDFVFLPGMAALGAMVALILALALGFAGTWRILGVPAAPYLRNE